MDFSEALANMQTHHSLVKMFLAHVLLPTILGGAVYILWRPSWVLVFDWLKIIGLDGPILFIRDMATPLRRVLGSWFVFSLPNGLWVYAFTWSTLLIWHGQVNSNEKVIWLVLPCLVAVSAEGLQCFGVIPGTFDWKDVQVCILGAICAVVIGQSQITTIAGQIPVKLRA